MSFASLSISPSRRFERRHHHHQHQQQQQQHNQNQQSRFQIPSYPSEDEEEEEDDSINSNHLKQPPQPQPSSSSSSKQQQHEKKCNSTMKSLKQKLFKQQSQQQQQQSQQQQNALRPSMNNMTEKQQQHDSSTSSLESFNPPFQSVTTTTTTASNLHHEEEEEEGEEEKHAKGRGVEEEEEEEDAELENWYLQQQQAEETERINNVSSPSSSSNHHPHPHPSNNTQIPAFASAVVTTIPLSGGTTTSTTTDSINSTTNTTLTTQATQTQQQQQQQRLLPSSNLPPPVTTTASRQTTSGTTITSMSLDSSASTASSSFHNTSNHSVPPPTAAAAAASAHSTTLVFSNTTTTTTAHPASQLSQESKRRKINILIDQCESTPRFTSPFSKTRKKSLILSNLNLTHHDVPTQEILSTGTLSTTLSKLSLSGNCLMQIPELLVRELRGLKWLDVSQCELKGLPGEWDLPGLKRLNLGHNKIMEFPCERMLKGIPELQHLDMYGNNIRTIHLPSPCTTTNTTTTSTTLSSSSSSSIITPSNNNNNNNTTTTTNDTSTPSCTTLCNNNNNETSPPHSPPLLLSKLESLNLGYNALTTLPPTLSTLTSLKILKVQNNIIEKIPVQVCEMDLRIIDVSSNPLIQPPVETCERGISSMRRYYSCLRLEQTQQKRMIEHVVKKPVMGIGGGGGSVKQKSGSRGSSFSQISLQDGINNIGVGGVGGSYHHYPLYNDSGGSISSLGSVGTTITSSAAGGGGSGSGTKMKLPRIGKKWTSSVKRAQTICTPCSASAASALGKPLQQQQPQQQPQQQSRMVVASSPVLGVVPSSMSRNDVNRAKSHTAAFGGGVGVGGNSLSQLSTSSSSSPPIGVIQSQQRKSTRIPSSTAPPASSSSSSSTKGELFKRVALSQTSPTPTTPPPPSSTIPFPGPLQSRNGLQQQLKQPAILVTQGPSTTTASSSSIPPPPPTTTVAVGAQVEQNVMRYRGRNSQRVSSPPLLSSVSKPSQLQLQQQQLQNGIIPPVIQSNEQRQFKLSSSYTTAKSSIPSSVTSSHTHPPLLQQQPPQPQQPTSLSSTTTTSTTPFTPLPPPPPPPSEKITCNNTLKVIFVGMAYSGKTSMIKRLIDGPYAKIPKRDERTVGVDIYEWDPSPPPPSPQRCGGVGGVGVGVVDEDAEEKKLDTSIVMEGEIEEGEDGERCRCEETNVKFSVWDFAGQHVYHATHELFFSQRALYVLVWDMGATNNDTQKRIFSTHDENDQGAFKLTYDSSDDEDGEDLITDDEVRRADRALQRDIDEKVQFWVDCIQSSAPGAAILPVASHDDFFESLEEDGGGAYNSFFSRDEAKRRCNLLKSRLLHHEQRRIRGLKQRLEKYQKSNRANADAALRLRKLLCPFSRPKLIFGEEEDNSVVRVSCTKYTGFDRLSEKLVHIATGRERGGWDYPIFRGHVGARIPRMRLQVRDVVRNMRDRFKVVEWGFFLSALREHGLDNVDDVSDALHFLTNVGELSYFGDVVQDYHQGTRRSPEGEPNHDETKDGENDVNGMTTDDDDDESVLTKDDPRTPLNGECSFSSNGTQGSSGLSQFVFLNPRWLVAAVACILRHNLTWKIHEIKRELSKHTTNHVENRMFRAENFYENNKNYPVITAEDACMLWQAEKFTKKAAERAVQYSNNVTMTPFAFLQRLLIRFGVFVPIDLAIDKACLGGREYGRSRNADDCCSNDISLPEINPSDLEETPRFFFLPSLLGPGEPSEVWTYKTSDSWKTTVCHSVLFPDGVPPGLMERITAAVLSDIYLATQTSKRNQDPNIATESNPDPSRPGSQGENLHVREILCWRAAFFLKIGMENVISDGETRESIVEIFCHLVDRESHLCVASESMGVGMRRLILSAKGQVGDGGKKIWNGGHKIVIRAVARVMDEYGGLEFDKQSICPECLQKKPVSQASVWDWTQIWSATRNGCETMRCQNGHSVDTKLLTGYSDRQQTSNPSDQLMFTEGEPIVSVTDLLGAVVLVGLWDEKSKKVLRAGSGFIVDKKRGLIVTASHTLMNIWGEDGSPFGEDYFGSRHGKVVIGVIPRSEDGNSLDGSTAMFRYFAKILAKDDNIEKKGICHMDACILAITTRMEEDIGGDGDGCGDQPEILLLNDPDAMKREKLQQLKVTVNCELEEKVRILGYNQGGEGLRGHGEYLNRTADFSRGYVAMKFATDEDAEGSIRQKFKPREEIVVMCYTIGGHSGGPCVNQQGDVIGILSRADPAEKHRCYLVPASEWKPLVKKAKKLSLF